MVHFEFGPIGYWMSKPAIQADRTRVAIWWLRWELWLVLDERRWECDVENEADGLEPEGGW